MINYQFKSLLFVTTPFHLFIPFQCYLLSITQIYCAETLAENKWICGRIRCRTQLPKIDLIQIVIYFQPNIDYFHEGVKYSAANDKNRTYKVNVFHVQTIRSVMVTHRKELTSDLKQRFIYFHKQNRGYKKRQDWIYANCCF